MSGATILPALITASPKLIEIAIQLWRGKDVDAETKKVLDQAYDKLIDYFTDHCVKVLLALEEGIFLPIPDLRSRLHPGLQLPEAAIYQFDSEFKYRLEYLRLTGVVALVAGSEYRITRLGRAFLNEARRRRDYSKVLFVH